MLRIKNERDIRTHRKQKERNEIQAPKVITITTGKSWWKRLRTIGKLLVNELDRYLEYNNLPMTGKKMEKVRLTVAHLYMQIDKDLNAPEHRFEDTSENESKDTESIDNLDKRQNLSLRVAHVPMLTI
ncbi:Hypothetical predicted protein [Paramuricea clavata]|uniref:Uncharacterized protein n=1 Tax=Paramuricea clavata TaxID=317549 RepID=A0A6S7FWB5_PARCT|nr:Hypothetical predicted protein [Paramuricea clavata]